MFIHACTEAKQSIGLFYEENHEATREIRQMQSHRCRCVLNHRVGLQQIYSEYEMLFVTIDCSKIASSYVRCSLRGVITTKFFQI